MNKRLIAFLSILSLSLSLPFIPANAAAKAGAKCAKAGSTEVVKDKSYTCVKSGKKLIWDKGKQSSIDCRLWGAGNSSEHRISNFLMFFSMP